MELFTPKLTKHVLRRHSKHSEESCHTRTQRRFFATLRMTLLAHTTRIQTFNDCYFFTGPDASKLSRIKLNTFCVPRSCFSLSL